MLAREGGVRGAVAQPIGVDEVSTFHQTSMVGCGVVYHLPDNAACLLATCSPCTVSPCYAVLLKALEW